MQRSDTRLVWGATLFTPPALKGWSHFPVVATIVILLGLALLSLLVLRTNMRPRPPDSGADDGWGRRPEPPRTPPPDPGGGIPLADAIQARVRLRGDQRLADLLRGPSRRGRREPHIPERRPARRRTPA